MPLYEYEAEDGARIELMRPMSQADAPVEDPEGKGRTFTRILSVFASKAASPGSSTAPWSGPSSGGCCPCGKNKGSCGG